MRIIPKSVLNNNVEDLDMDTFQHLQQRMAKFVEERDWNQFHNPKNLTMAIAVEAAELMEIFQWMDNSEAYQKAIDDIQTRSELKDEIADILIYCLSLANITKIDLKSCINDKMDRNEERFPPQGTI